MKSIEQRDLEEKDLEWTDREEKDQEEMDLEWMGQGDSLLKESLQEGRVLIVDVMEQRLMNTPSEKLTALNKVC